MPMIEDILSFMYLHPEITVIGAVTLIQIAPIKIDPWTKIAKWLRKAIVGDVEAKMDRLSEKVDRLEERVEEDQAKQARTHILRFASELYENRTHSQEYFQEILDEIKAYTKYCDDHPRFLNGRTEQACKQIKEVHDHLWGEHRF